MSERDRILGRVAQRARRVLCFHGLCVTTALATASCLTLYALDRGFDLPRALRLTLALAGVAATMAVLARRVGRPWLRSWNARDAALALERRFPQLNDRLITAVQLEGDTPLVGIVAAEADALLADLPIRESVDGRTTMRPAGAAALACSVILAVAFLDPHGFPVFLQRALGAETPWPRRTFLEITLPGSRDELRVEATDGGRRVFLARGSDLHVRVGSTGTAPGSVRLVAGDGAERPAVRTGPGEFAGTWRTVTEPFTFWAEGGDHPPGAPSIQVVPLVPVEVTDIAVHLEYPAYIGLPPLDQPGGTVEAPIGTVAEVRVQVSVPTSQAHLRFLESGEEFPLESGPDGVLSASFLVEASDRYAVKLVGRNGLGNPAPGSWPVRALEDRRPMVQLIRPARADVDITASGRLPLRVRAVDDFGLATVMLAAAPPGSPARETALWTAGETLEREALVRLLLDAQELGDEVIEGAVFDLAVRAADNREPNAQQATTPPVRIRVVSAAELLQRIADDLRTMRRDVESLRRLQEDRMDRVDRALDLAESGGWNRDEAAGVAGIALGQERVAGSAGRLAEGLLGIVERSAYNGLDREANAIVSVLEGAADGRTDAALLEADRQGLLGAPEFAGPVVEMLAQAVRIRDDLAVAAVAALEEASLEPEHPAALLGRARAAQSEVLAATGKLLRLLAKWDDYQALVGRLREILEGQRALEGRTREGLEQ